MTSRGARPFWEESEVEWAGALHPSSPHPQWGPAVDQVDPCRTLGGSLGREARGMLRTAKVTDLDMDVDEDSPGSLWGCWGLMDLEGFSQMENGEHERKGDPGGRNQEPEA